jgi:hypothetical protein
MMARGIDFEWKLTIIADIGITLKIRGVSRRISQSLSHRLVAGNHSTYLRWLLRNGHSS